MQLGQAGIWGWSNPKRFFEKDQKWAATRSISQSPDLGHITDSSCCSDVGNQQGICRKERLPSPKSPGGGSCGSPEPLLSSWPSGTDRSWSWTDGVSAGAPAGLEFGKQHGFCKSPCRALCPLAVSQTKGPCSLNHEAAAHHLCLPSKC